ncbi:MAG: hypothetical protein K2P88_00215 [Chitinophagaceae bacterium]|uniref:hypothetical protein n=1 Tax=unclassified Paraflavitalea TaxID=2798305 RepID=UPI003D335F69|nr:hypothetical protein [Chitinophagaceae bacterium]
MGKSEDYIIDQIVLNAPKFGIPTAHAALYCDLTSDLQFFLQQQVPDSSGEPIVLFWKDQDNWTLVCTIQLITKSRNQLQYIPIQAIDQSQSTVPFLQIAKDYSDNSHNELVLTTVSGTAFTAPTASVKDRIGLMNIIQQIQSMRA